jgi:hypothetical protein
MLSVIMLSVIMLSVIMLSAIMLSATMPSVIMPSVIMLTAIILSVIMLSAIMHSVFMLSVFMLTAIILSIITPNFLMLIVLMPSVIMLSVVAPRLGMFQHFINRTKLFFEEGVFLMTMGKGKIYWRWEDENFVNLPPLHFLARKFVFKWRHDYQCNDTKHIDTQHEGFICDIDT